MKSCDPRVDSWRVLTICRLFERTIIHNGFSLNSSNNWAWINVLDPNDQFGIRWESRNKLSSSHSGGKDRLPRSSPLAKGNREVWKYRRREKGYEGRKWTPRGKSPNNVDSDCLQNQERWHCHLRRDWMLLLQISNIKRYSCRVFSTTRGMTDLFWTLKM